MVVGLDPTNKWPSDGVPLPSFLSSGAVGSLCIPGPKEEEFVWTREAGGVLV